MKKKVKGIVGLCLVAALAVGGVGTYAYANPISFNDYYEDQDGHSHLAWGECSVGATSGSAYTTVSDGWPCYGSVSATFSCYAGARVLFSNGNAAGNVHGAGVTITYNGNASEVQSSYISANHTIEVPGRAYYETTHDTWCE